MRELTVSEQDLIDFDLLKQGANQWKFRFSVGSPFKCASSKEKAVSYATEAYLKASRDELLTKSQRFDKACREEIESSHTLWGHMDMTKLLTMFEKLGGDTSSLQIAAKREFNSNGGRRTSCAVSAQGARDTAAMRMKLERYIEWRKDHA
ncbi:phage tail protein [Paramixta manurensis]|uniref:Phage tail protein n=1 Tax=Paramixta manurensis TaxID=2740817 RepID=A0A6M8U9U5_9GAMM|nr:phage tail protein [Erwiniaceae bacterium PD-1]